MGREQKGVASRRSVGLQLIDVNLVLGAMQAVHGHPTGIAVNVSDRTHEGTWCTPNVVLPSLDRDHNHREWERL